MKFLSARGYLIPIRNSDDSFKNHVGGKGHHLIKLSLAGFNVAPGCVISSQLFFDIIRYLGLRESISEHLKREEYAALKSIGLDIKHHLQNDIEIQSIFQQLQREVYKSSSTPMIVRSSHTNEDSKKLSFAGVFVSSTNVSASQFHEALVSSYYSLFSNRALSYYQANKIQKLGNMAIIIQSMIDAQLSGIAFSENLSEANSNEILLEYSREACESLVDGYEPDARVTLRKTPKYTCFELLRHSNELKMVYQAMLSLEELFSEQIDVEWAVAQDKLWIFQCRPITTQLPSDSYTFTSRNNISLWLNDASTIDYFGVNKKFYNVKDYLYYFNNGYIERFGSQQDLETLFNVSYQLLDKQYFKKTKETMDSLYKETWGLFDRLWQCSPDDTGAHRLELIKDICRLLNHTIYYFKFSSDQVMSRLFAILEMHVGLECAQVLSFYTELDCIDEEKIALSKLSSTETQARVEEHIKKFPWLVTNCVTLEQAMDYVCARLQSKRDCSNKVKQNKKRLLQQQQKILNQLNLPFAILELINKIQFLGYSRLKMKLAYAGMDFYTLKLMQCLSTQYKIPRQHFHDFYLMADIIKMLKESKPLEVSMLKKRQSAFLIHLKDNQLHCNYDSLQVSAFAKNYLEPNNNDALEKIYGRTVSKGCVTAKAVVITSNSLMDINTLKTKLHKDTIIICDMLQPNMGVFIKDVAGIIADEGGVLSHAAILAREYQIPCLVGTKIATKQIKDGDKIILNATASYFQLL